MLRANRFSVSDGKKVKSRKRRVASQVFDFGTTFESVVDPILVGEQTFTSQDLLLAVSEIINSSTEI